jgi:hypothetical protein
VNEGTERKDDGKRNKKKKKVKATKMQQNIRLLKCCGSKFVWTAADCNRIKGVITSALVSNKLSYCARL